MSEVIKATLTADSSELQAEFAKARKASEDYHRRVEESQSKALRGEMDQLRLLRLQAEGRQTEANALREKIGLQAQAEAMAKRIGLTEQESLNLLQQRAQLERQISARTNAGKPNIQNLPLTAGELNAVWTQSEKARASLKATHRAAGGAGMGMLQLAQTADDAQYGMRGIVNNIPGLVMGLGGSAGLAGAFGLAVVGGYSLYKLIGVLTGDTALQKWNEAQTKGWEAYGKALEQNLTRLRELRRSEKLGDELAEARERETKAIKESIGYDKEKFAIMERQAQALANQRRLEDELTKARQSVAEAKAGTPEQKRAVEAGANRDRFKTQDERLAQNIAAAQKEIAESGKLVEASGRATAEQWTKQQAAISQANVEIEKAREAVATYEAEVTRIDAVLGEKAGKGNAAMLKQEERNREIARKKLDDAKAMLEAKEGEKKNAEYALKLAQETREQSRKELLDRITAAKARKEQLEAERKNLAQLLKLEEERAKAEQKRAEEARQIEKDTANKDFNTETEALKLEVAGHKKAAELLREQNVTRKEATELAKQLGITEAEARKKLEGQASLRRQIAEQSQIRATQTLTAELKILQLQALGRNKQAEALKKEKELRDKIRTVMEQTGASEADATKYIRKLQKAEMNKELGFGSPSNIRRAPEYHGSRIPMATGINAAGGRRIDAAGGRVPNAAGGRRIGNPRPFGLKRHESRRRQSQRGAGLSDAMRAAGEAKNYYDKSITSLSNIEAAFKKLGVL
jgi:hypothetical protein